MHIALYSPAWPPGQHPNGIITYVDHLTTELRRQGHKVSIFSGVMDGATDEEDVYRIEARLSTLQRAQRKLSKLFPSLVEDTSTWGHLVGKKIKEVSQISPIDVVEVEESFGWCLAVQTVTSLPVVVKLHGPAFLDLLDETASQAGQQKMKLEGQALGQMNFITSPSADTLSQTLKHYGLKPVLAETIPNPMVPASENDLWSLDGCDRKNLLFIGRFDLRKGGDLVLRAFKQLLQSDPELKLVFAGPDRGIPDANGRILQFDEYASTLFSPQQRASISYLGPVPPARIPSLRKTAMVTLIASRWDNQPNTALEAMMQCCPVVAVDAGGVGEIVAHQSSGLLARNNDLTDFCNQISFMLANPEAAAEMGRHARQIIAVRHAASRLADATLAVYRQAIAVAKSARPGAPG